MKKIAVVIGGSVCVALLIWVAVFRSATEQRVTRATAVDAGYMQLSNAGQTEAQKPSASASTPSVIAAARESKAQMIEQAAKSGSPQEKFEAYKLIRACVAARSDELLQADRVAYGGKAPSKTAHEVCDDINPGQIAGRDQLLKAAATAGIHGASASLATEGPTGEGFAANIDPSSPEYAAFASNMAEALKAGAKNGDWWSLITLSGQKEQSAETPQDYQLAIDDLEHANQAYRKENGTDLRSYAQNKGRLTYFYNQSLAKNNVQVRNN